MGPLTHVRESVLSLTLSGQQQGGGRMSSDAAQQQLLPPSTSLSAAASSASFLPDYLLDADYVFGRNMTGTIPRQSLSSSRF